MFFELESIFLRVFWVLPIATILYNEILLNHDAEILAPTNNRVVCCFLHLAVG